MALSTTLLALMMLVASAMPAFADYNYRPAKGRDGSLYAGGVGNTGGLNDQGGGSVYYGDPIVTSGGGKGDGGHHCVGGECVGTDYSGKKN